MTSTFFDNIIEPKDPSDTHEDWAQLDSTLNASIGSLDARYSRSTIPELGIIKEWSGAAWRGEKTSIQMVLWTKTPVNNIHFMFTDFAGQDQSLPSTIAQARFVRYVLTDVFGEGDGCADRSPEDFPVYLVPDILDNITSYNITEPSTRPVWVTIKVPQEAEPGQYTGTLFLHADDQPTQEFTLSLEVQPRVLPPPSQWKFHLDLWQHPYAIARKYNVEPWSPEHWEILTPLMKMLADAGQKVITTTINEKPWGGQSLDPYESMIKWTRHKDSTWHYDYIVFDRWVEFMIKIGIDKQINAYSLIPWTSELVYYDVQQKKTITKKVETGSQEYIDLWTPFIKDFRAHLSGKGWIHKTNLAMDEIKGDPMEQMLKVMKNIAPEFSLASADSEKAYKRFPDRISDLTVTYAVIIDKPDLEYRKSKGYLSTFYVCCREPYPNQFTFSPPVESTFMGWYSIANGFDGFLRWAYANWVKDPLHDTRFRKWPAGDTNFVYPGPRSSIRFERLIEGIQDAEKIRLLKEEYTKSNTPFSMEQLAKLNDMLSTFTGEPRQSEIPKLVRHGKSVLYNLANNSCSKT